MCTQVHASEVCDKDGVWLQVLGSGGPELDDGRASSGYVIWVNGKSRFLVDMGSGSLHNFEKSGASVNDLDAVVLSHLHVDHSNDLPALVKASFFTDRSRNLHLYGPTGNRFMPSLTQYVQNLIGPEGAYHYLSRYLDGSESYRLLLHDIAATGKKLKTVFSDAEYQLSAVTVHHGSLPALAWQVAIAGKKIVFSGDMNNDNHMLSALARKADLLIIHHAIPEGTTGVARNLHMPPSVIGAVAAEAGVRQLVLSHHMNRTLGKESEATTHVRRSYAGPLYFANDRDCFKP